MADGIVVVPTIPSGVNIDNTAFTRYDNTALQRQRVDIPGTVSIAGDLLTDLLIELRVISYLLAAESGFQEDLNNIRNDLTITTETK